MPWMLPTIIKNLFSKPATRKYPFEKREPFEATRGRLYWDMEKCDLCGDCARVCASSAIEVDEEKGEIRWDPFKCIYCRLCVESCLQKAITMDKHYMPPEYEKRVEIITRKKE